MRLQRVFTWQRARSVWEWFRCKGKVRKSPAFVFLLGDAHKALPSKYYSLTWLRSDTPQTRPETILTSHIKYSRSWMWFLNKLGAVFSAETGIFLYYISRLHFHKRLKKWLCNEKKYYRNSLWPRIFGYGDAAVTQQWVYISQTAWNWEHWHTLFLWFRKVCSAAGKRENPNSSFLLLKGITFWHKLLGGNYQNREQPKGNYVTNTSQSPPLEEKLPRMDGSVRLGFISLGKITPKISRGKIKGIIVIAR